MLHCSFHIRADTATRARSAGPLLSLARDSPARLLSRRLRLHLPTHTRMQPSTSSGWPPSCTVSRQPLPCGALKCPVATLCAALPHCDWAGVAAAVGQEAPASAADKPRTCLVPPPSRICVVCRIRFARLWCACLSLSLSPGVYARGLAGTASSGAKNNTLMRDTYVATLNSALRRTGLTAPASLL
jgi:hypothetical protein